MYDIMADLTQKRTYTIFKKKIKKLFIPTILAIRDLFLWNITDPYPPSSPLGHGMWDGPYVACFSWLPISQRIPSALLLEYLQRRTL